uniref:Alpha-2-macroglobulin-like n=1 Tax=Anabas testudineus TaxID=64144 RepID=A0A3Q1J7H3_ANATE
MGHPGVQMWTWTLFVLSWLSVYQVLGKPQYMVAIPAVLEAGSETKFCASLLQPEETLTMTVSLISDDERTTLLKQTSSEEFHICHQFKVPLVQQQTVQTFDVEVRGNKFYSRQVRKVMIKVYQSMTFVQTDKPIYLPGQTGNIKLLLYNIIEIEDANGNRIGQWLNVTSNSKILQLSYSLNSEAREGPYKIIVSVAEKKVYDFFKVEKYVLPKFDVKIKASDEVSIVQEEIKAEVCAEYTYGQSVPGRVQFEACRPLSSHFPIFLVVTPEHPEGVPEVTAPCYKETKKVKFPQHDHLICHVVVNVQVGKTPRMQHPGYGTAFYAEGEHRLSLAQDVSQDIKTVSSLEVKKKDKPLSCDTEEDIVIQYTIVGEAQGIVDVIYLVGDGHKQIEVKDKSGGQRSGLIMKMAPEFQVVAYTVLPSETVIANSADFSTEKCFSHKVSLEFSPSSAVPGEKTTMQVTAEPDSLCGVSAVDQSVLIKEPGKGLNADKVKTNVGLKMATNTLIRMPSCLKFKGRLFFFHNHGAFIPDAPPVVTVRTFFPETWIWDLVEVGESGTKDVSLTVPDTITTWETEAFCLSSQGFGLAPRKKLTVFQPFFLELTLPYSIIRGEHFELKATIFNYLTSCIMVTVTPAPSLDYTLTPLSGDQYTSCLCGNERKTLSWTMVPSVLGVVNVSVTAEAVASHASCDNEIVSVPDRGRIDVVTKSLIVKAEGTEMAKAHNWLLCPRGEALTEEIDIQLPENVIDGSARASVSVLGDILGRALQNLGGLLRMPYGCGEQNMALLAPNIYILQYLKNTQQLTPAIREKATNFLTSGYQRQLNYKHNDGAYSTFGSGPGNTWLTAFVLRSFTKAQTFIYIDPTKIEESKTWLKNKQRENGCFEQSGKLFHNGMKGGVSDEVTLTAYITAAFLEMNIPVITKSLSCLKESISDLSNTYTTALLAYVFTLAGDMKTRGHLLQHLDTVASKQGGFHHWSQTAAETSASLSVEISSYVVLAKLSGSPTAEELGYSSCIVRWLTGQQNYYGGFSSTQDTVVALQALALYSTLAFSPQSSSTVTVQSPSGQLTFDVNQDNKLLYQEKTLQDTTGKYSLEVKGTACASIQISLHYNIPTPPDVTTLSVEVKPEADCNSESPRPKLTLKYSGKLDSTNMVILDIKMLSGFVMITQLNIVSSQLKRALFVDRVEEKEDHVLMYIQQLPKDKPINHQLELVQEIPVQNLKPAVVKIYDYYQPSDQAETEYIYPCVAGNSAQ